MARYEHLKVFQVVYKLNLHFYEISRGFPKEYKYGLADDIRKGLTYILIQIMQANQVVQKESYLRRATMTLDIATVKVRMLHDLKIINLRRYEFLSRQLVEAGSQLEAWRTWSKGGRS